MSDNIPLKPRPFYVEAAADRILNVLRLTMLRMNRGQNLLCRFHGRWCCIYDY